MKKLVYTIQEKELVEQILKELGEEIIDYDWELRVVNYKPNRRFIFRYILKKRNKLANIKLTKK